MNRRMKRRAATSLGILGLILGSSACQIPLPFQTDALGQPTNCILYLFEPVQNGINGATSADLFGIGCTP